MESEELAAELKNMAHAMRALAEQIQLCRNEQAALLEALQEQDGDEKKSKKK